MPIAVKPQSVDQMRSVQFNIRVAVPEAGDVARAKSYKYLAITCTTRKTEEAPRHGARVAYVLN